MQIVVDAAGYMSDAGTSQPCPGISDVHWEQDIDLPHCGINNAVTYRRVNSAALMYCSNVTKPRR